MFYSKLFIHLLFGCQIINMILTCDIIAGLFIIPYPLVIILPHSYLVIQNTLYHTNNNFSRLPTRCKTALPLLRKNRLFCYAALRGNRHSPS